MREYLSALSARSILAQAAAKLPVPCKLFYNLGRWIPTHGAAGIELLLQAALRAPTKGEKDTILEGIAQAARLGRPLSGSFARSRSRHLQHRIPAFANAASDAALKGSANCFWPDSASKIAAAERFGWYSIVNENRVKQSLSPHHFADTDKHLVTERLHKLVCQASFQPRRFLLALACDMADVPRKGPTTSSLRDVTSRHFCTFTTVPAKLEAQLTQQKRRSWTFKPRNEAKEEKEAPQELRPVLPSSWTFTHTKEAGDR